VDRRTRVRALPREASLSENTLVDVLLGLGVAAELLCCVGVALMRTVYDRLHYSGAATAVGPFFILAALLVREGLSSEGMQAIAAVALLFLLNPTLVHATARAARRIDVGSPRARPEERGGEAR
jgi:monovalent cation/proton antiporter MnhG/PhaG subunit